METGSISSKRLEAAVLQFAKLPGIGKKTALRLVLHLLRQDKSQVSLLVNALQELSDGVRYCRECHNLSDSEICNICMHPSRNKSLICVVENIRDVISIESTGQYNGVYHVLGGLIAPLEGIGPDQLTIDLLNERCSRNEVLEIIMALSPNIEGDTTVYYIARMLRQHPGLKITSIARGIAFGGELEYADEFTLGKALNKRLPIDNYISSL